MDAQNFFSDQWRTENIRNPQDVIRRFDGFGDGMICYGHQASRGAFGDGAAALAKAYFPQLDAAVGRNEVSAIEVRVDISIEGVNEVLDLAKRAS